MKEPGKLFLNFVTSDVNSEKEMLSLSIDLCIDELSMALHLEVAENVFNRRPLLPRLITNVHSSTDKPISLLTISKSFWNLLVILAK